MTSGEKKKRVLLVVRQLGLGGTEKHIFDLATRLDPARFSVEVMYFIPGGEIAASLESAGVCVHLAERKVKYDPLFPMRLAARMAGKYDVVHAFLPSAIVWSIPPAAMAFVPRRIASIRGLEFALSASTRFSVSAAAQFANRVLCNSEAARKKLSDTVGIRRGKIEVIYNAVDCERFSPRVRDDAWENERKKSGFPDGSARVIGCVANLTPVKNHRMLLNAMRRVITSMPDVQLMLIGDGPLRAELEAYANKMEIGGSVKFLGPRNDVADLLRLMDVFVLSSDSESLPNSICEAMVAGLPVVATDVGGIGEIVRNGETGYLVPSGDAESFAKQIVAVLGSREHAARMGTSAERFARERFSMQAMIRRMEEIYSES